MAHLEQNGYAIVDNFLGREWALAIRDEIKWLQEQELLFPNQVRKPRVWGGSGVGTYECACVCYLRRCV